MLLEGQALQGARVSARARHIYVLSVVPVGAMNASASGNAAFR